jgi:hypothetical protein
MRRGARTNLALLGLLGAAFLTGWLAFAFATAPARWSLLAHAVSGFAILLLLPWKSLIARRGVARPRRGRWASVVFSILVLASLLAGLLHSTGLLRWWGDLTAMDIHVGAAIAAVPFAAWHVARRRVRLRPADLSRRSLLRGGAVIAGATLAYGASEAGVRVLGLAGARRRYTGSYDAGSFRPDQMPVSSWILDPIPDIDPTAWRLEAGARTWTYQELLRFDDQITATLDCTGGFCSTQEWSGAWLSRLLEPGDALSVRVVSATGYDRRFPVEELGRLLLATRFGGVPLDPGHGFPVRLVAPERRGFWWVKWVRSLQLEGLPHWWQSPFPLQ